MAVCFGECVMYCMCCVLSKRFAWWNSLLAWLAPFHFFLYRPNFTSMETHTHGHTHRLTAQGCVAPRVMADWFFPPHFALKKAFTSYTHTHTYACLPPCTICFSVTKLKRDLQSPEMFRGITPSSLFLRLYAVGGRDGSSCLRSVECFDPHTNRSETGDFICQQLIAVSYFVSCLRVPLVKRLFLLGYLPTDQRRLVTLTGC